MVNGGCTVTTMLRRAGEGEGDVAEGGAPGAVPQVPSAVAGRGHRAGARRPGPGRSDAGGTAAHAFLFCGPRGTGKTSTARILARMVNCEKGPTAEPCGVCEQCVRIREGSHLDVVEIDAASHGGVDDARELRERAPTAPAMGREKVYIIDEAQRLSREAFDALLKMFEEPPPGVRFVLATTEPHKMPATIVGPVPAVRLPPGGHGHARRPPRARWPSEGGTLGSAARSAGPAGRGVGSRRALAAGPGARPGRRDHDETVVRALLGAPRATSSTSWPTRSRSGTRAPSSRSWTGWSRRATTCATSPARSWGTSGTCCWSGRHPEEGLLDVRPTDMSAARPRPRSSRWASWPGSCRCCCGPDGHAVDDVAAADPGAGAGPGHASRGRPEPRRPRGPARTARAAGESTWPGSGGRRAAADTAHPVLGSRSLRSSVAAYRRTPPPPSEAPPKSLLRTEGFGATPSTIPEGRAAPRSPSEPRPSLPSASGRQPQVARGGRGSLDMAIRRSWPQLLDRLLATRQMILRANLEIGHRGGLRRGRCSSWPSRRRRVRRAEGQGEGGRAAQALAGGVRRPAGIRCVAREARDAGGRRCSRRRGRGAAVRTRSARRPGDVRRAGRGRRLEARSSPWRTKAPSRS